VRATSAARVQVTILFTESVVVCKGLNCSCFHCDEQVLPPPLRNKVACLRTEVSVEMRLCIPTRPSS
jgi:hypothetical protein